MPNDPNDPFDPFEPLRTRNEPEVHEAPRQTPPDETASVMFGEDPGNVDAEDLDES